MESFVSKYIRNRNLWSRVYPLGKTISDTKNKTQVANNEPMQDPINALQNLASQGTRNPMQPQMSMGMGGPMGPGGNPNSNVLQNLIHVSIEFNYIEAPILKLFVVFSATKTGTATADAKYAWHASRPWRTDGCRPSAGEYSGGWNARK